MSPSTRSGFVPPVPPAAPPVPFAGARIFMCCEPVASAMRELCPAQELEADFRIETFAHLFQCGGRNSRHHGARLACRLARESLDPAKADPRRRRGVQVEFALYRWIEHHRCLRASIHRRKIRTHAPRYGRSSRKPSSRHLLTLFLVAVNHDLDRPAQTIPLRHHGTESRLVPEHLGKHRRAEESP